MTHPPLILASSSPRRRELLASLGLTFSIIKPDVDESLRNDEAPLTYVQRLSREKAQAVAVQALAPAMVLAADTVVILAADTIGIDERGEILGKPADADEARQMLRRLRKRAHIVCTAVTICPVKTAPLVTDSPLWTELTQTTVYMRDYADAEIEAYIATGDPFDKAGSYAIQHEGFHPVERIEGSYTNVVGFPLETVRVLLEQAGFTLNGT